MKKVVIVMALISATAIFAGCKLMEVASSVGVAAGVISPQQAQSINKSADAVGKTFESITPEQEYYIGRAVAATVLKTYKPYDNSKANNYLNVLGQTLATASDKPETFGGYHFLIMDTDEINAFATPGGLIFVSRGLIKLCDSEDAVAAVLAHEIGHVQLQHGLQAIKKSRLTSALTILATESAKNLGGQNLANLTTAFEGSINDITSTMVNSGYARKYETAADNAAVTILKRVSYNPNGLKNMLEQMDTRMDHNGAGFAKTHPDPKSRIKDIEPLTQNFGPISAPAERQNRFKEALAGI